MSAAVPLDLAELDLDLDLDVDALRTELEDNRPKVPRHDQILGKLLDARDSLKCELSALKEDNALLKKCLELQKQDSFRGLQECKSDAEIKIAQLEDELEERTEKTTGSTSQEDKLQQSLEQLTRENQQLNKELSQLVQEHRDELMLAKRNLEVRERKHSLLKSELLNTRKQLEMSAEENQELERRLTRKHASHEQLDAELQITKQEADAWKYQCICNGQLLNDQDNKLNNAQDQLLQLQQELNSSRESLQSPSCSTPKISRATSSLFDELYDTESKPAAPCSPSSVTSTTPILAEQRVCSDESPTSQDSTAETCLKCVELQSRISKQQEEIDVLEKQLFAVIQQKIKLHKEAEEWQSDVEKMFRSNVQQKLSWITSPATNRGAEASSKVADNRKVKKLPLKPTMTS